MVSEFTKSEVKNFFRKIKFSAFWAREWPALPSYCVSGSYNAYDWEDAEDELSLLHAYKVGDLVRFVPSRRVWDYYDPWGYRINTPSENQDCLGIVVYRYRTYGSYSQIYYRVKWIGIASSSPVSNEKHQDLMLVSAATITGHTGSVESS